MSAPSSVPSSPDPSGTPPSWFERFRRFFVGKPRDLADSSVFHHTSLIPLLAWVGLGADGLSSSAYGPEEAFRALGQHTYLAAGLALLTAVTVFIIASAYSHIIEEFPHGGGGYLVATKLLGEKWGLVSGSALLVDYVLTITISIAAAGDALFSFLPPEWAVWKHTAEFFFIGFLTVINLRGVKESVTLMAPVFMLFVVTHFILIVGGIGMHLGELPQTAARVSGQFDAGLAALGAFGLLRLFVHAYSLGGGTYTGIEAVSNGLAIMREPRVETGKRTMVYMAVSLAFAAGGLIACYLLWDVQPVPGKTLNAVLLEEVTAGFPGGGVFVVVTLFSAAALLIVAAQAGFIDGPRVLANMAVDSWVPRRFAALSERLTTQNGILLMGATALLALVYTHGAVDKLVVMYSINVFVTFSLSMFALLRLWWGRRGHPDRARRLVNFGTGFVFCATILTITVIEKFGHGGWVTVAATGVIVALCLVIRSHYRQVSAKLQDLFDELKDVTRDPVPTDAPLDPSKPTAVVLVAGYGGLGIHTVLNIFRVFPGHYRNLIMISVGVVDSGSFKGEGELKALEEQTAAMLKRYEDLGRGLGIPTGSRFVIGTDAVDEAEKLCVRIREEFPKSVFFAGKVIFQRENWTQKLLHNETAFAIQRRLQWDGITMVVLPARMKG